MKAFFMRQAVCHLYGSGGGGGCVMVLVGSQPSLGDEALSGSDQKSSSFEVGAPAP
ncbi:MAG: hypothetical protein ACJAR5_001875 [Pseudophaeobacter arcticus]|jgi:hypothetical protein